METVLSSFVRNKGARTDRSSDDTVVQELIIRPSVAMPIIRRNEPMKALPLS